MPTTRSDQPAFPYTPQNATVPWPGVTKRELFAALAMQQYISYNMGREKVAETAVDQADKLIKALNEKDPPSND